MRKIEFVIATLSMVSGLLGATPCLAQNRHSYVSVNGNDGNACTLTAPCLNLSRAVSATNSGGEVSCLDDVYSTGLAAATISQSITIDCAGVSFGQWRFTIDGDGIIVTLRHINIDSFGAGSSGVPGINFVNGAALFIENCVVQGWNDGPGIGINFAPSSGTARLYVTDSVIKNNGVASPAAGGGIYIQPHSGAAAEVTIERSKIENNRAGIVASAGGASSINGVVRDSVVSGSITSWGIGAVGANATLAVTSTTVSRNAFGLVAQAGASILVSHSTIVLNTTGLYTASGGSLVSFKNNDVLRNAAGNGPFTTSVTEQ